MTDRRRIVGPPGATNPPVFTVAPQQHKPTQQQRQRKPNELRKICMTCYWYHIIRTDHT